MASNVVSASTVSNNDLPSVRRTQLITIDQISPTNHIQLKQWLHGIQQQQQQQQQANYLKFSHAFLDIGSRGVTGAPQRVVLDLVLHVDQQTFQRRKPDVIFQE